MSKQKIKQSRPVANTKSSVLSKSTEQKKLETQEFTQIGGSPVPGLTLRHVLQGHASKITQLVWSPDGSYLASASLDNTVRVWDAQSGSCISTVTGHTGHITGLAWSPDARQLASGSRDGTIRLWSIETPEHEKIINLPGGSLSLAWVPSGQALISSISKKTRGGPFDNRYVWTWDFSHGKAREYSLGPTLQRFSLSPDGKLIAGAGYQKSPDFRLDLFDGETMKFLSGDRNRSLEWKNSFDVAWEPNGKFIASGSQEGVVHIWDPHTAKLLLSREGHTTDDVQAVSFGCNGRLLASKAEAIILWRCDTWAAVARLDEQAGSPREGWVAFHPLLPILATMGGGGTFIRLWELDEALLLGHAQDGVRYTTAKLVLVGDSGVGKTGLGWRLAHGEFKEHSSTHGQQFWAIPRLGLTRADGTECEAVLWDLAGQHVYRQIHSIFLENVAAALVLFDPGNRQDPLKGVEFWLEQLKGNRALPPAILVGARVDRGTPALAQQDLDQFCQRYGIQGGYISTSALNAEGLEALLGKLKSIIPWDKLTATVTTVTFKRIKDYVLALKGKPDRKGVLVSPGSLRAQLQSTDREWEFSDAEMMTAVGHLETHGYISVLHSSAGDENILLAPDLLVTLASSIVLLADKNPRELGAVGETDLLNGKYPFEELKGLDTPEQQILLDAAILRFLQHNICFRETLGNDTLLIFPGLIKQKRPLQDDLPATDDISYVVRGRVENLYASLVVLLGYTPSFTRINQWQNQAQYEMSSGEICGFRLIEDREGEIELVLYYGDSMPAVGRAKFQELFEQFLYQREVEVTHFPPVACRKGHRLERATVIKRVRDSKTFAFCDECGEKVGLPDFEKPQIIGIGPSPWLQLEEAAARLRSTYEVQLTRVKSYRRGWSTPRCYISHMPEQADWAEKLAHDVRDAGIYVLEQATHVRPEDFVILLDTSAYQESFESPVLAASRPLVRARLGKRQLLSLRLEGHGIMHEYNDCTPGDFCDDTHYVVSLFGLILNLYAIPLTHASFEPARQTLHKQWQQRLAGFLEARKTMAPKIFISYSHRDERYKDELVKMLAGLQRRGVIETWQDRRIDPGAEWFNAIKQAITDCQMAVLLVSADFIASPFINSEELPDLLRRREKEGMIIIPIVVRDCLWQSEPVLNALQALPKDGKPVNKFPRATGARDQVWTEIGQTIEKCVREKTIL